MPIEVKWDKDRLHGYVFCDCEICKPPKKPGEKKYDSSKKSEHCAAYTKACEEVDKEENKNRQKERARQEALIAGPRSKAKEPLAAKVGETIPARRARKWYGQYGIVILSHSIGKEDEQGNPIGEKSGPYIDELNMTMHEGEKVFEILAPLPTPEKFNELRDIYYTTTLEALVSDGFSAIEELAGEMRDRCDNYPENLQGTEKYEEIGSCADSLEEIREVDAPDNESIGEKTLVYLPVMDCSSRSDRLCSAVAMLRKAAEFLQTAANFEPEQVEDAKYWGDEIEEAVSNTDDISFPGMY